MNKIAALFSFFLGKNGIRLLELWLCHGTFLLVCLHFYYISSSNFIELIFVHLSFRVNNVYLSLYIPSIECMCVDIKLNELLCYRKTTETIYSIESHLQRDLVYKQLFFFLSSFCFLLFFFFPCKF